MWNKSGSSYENGIAVPYYAMAPAHLYSRQASEQTGERASGWVKKKYRRKIIETIKNRLKLRLQERPSNPQFFPNGDIPLAKDTDEPYCFGFARQWKARTERLHQRQQQQEKIVMEMWWIELCACLLLNKAKSTQSF